MEDNFLLTKCEFITSPDMTKKEFEDLAKVKVTREEYKKIEEMYYAVNMSKDVFCKQWKKYGRNPLTIELTKQINTLNRMLEERNNEADDRLEKNKEIAEFLLGKASVYNDPDFYNIAVRLIGQKTVTLTKIAMGLQLWEEDANYINKNLK